jgi:hypothetical protein
LDYGIAALQKPKSEKKEKKVWHYNVLIGHQFSDLGYVTLLQLPHSGTF